MNFATGALVVSALTLTGFRVRDYLAPTPQAARQIEDGAEFAAAGQVIGPASPRVRIVEFADYQCPFCADAQAVLDSLMERYPGEVGVLYRHYPLSIHDSAHAAARAAECAGTVGAFERFHRYVFSNADSIGKQSWHWFAEGAGVANIATFDACVASGREFESIARDKTAGDELGVNATPTFVVGDLMLTGLPRLAEFDRLVRKRLEHETRR